MIRATATAGPHHQPAGSISFKPTFPFQIELSLLKIHRRKKGGELVRSEADMSAASLRGPETWILSAPSIYFDII